jgi:AcrR family transcriptional regulator
MTIRERSPARDRILDVADRLFYERGIHAVGVDTVVAASAVAKTTLYSHFRSKDELIAAYLRRRSEQWLAFVDAELAAQRGGPTRRILRVFDLLRDWFTEPGYRGCPFINACAEFTSDHPATAVTRAHRQQLLTRFVDLATEGGATSPDRLAAQLMLLYDAAMVSAQIDGDPTPARTARDAASVLLAQAFPTPARSTATRRS